MYIDAYNNPVKKPQGIYAVETDLIDSGNYDLNDANDVSRLVTDAMGEVARQEETYGAWHAMINTGVDAGILPIRPDGELTDRQKQDCMEYFGAQLNMTAEEFERKVSLIKKNYYSLYREKLIMDAAFKDGIILTDEERKKVFEKLGKLVRKDEITQADYENLSGIMDMAGNDYERFLEMGEEAGFNLIRDGGLLTDIQYSTKMMGRGLINGLENLMNFFLTTSSGQNPYSNALDVLKQEYENSKGTFLEDYNRHAYYTAVDAAQTLTSERQSAVEQRLNNTRTRQMRTMAMDQADFQDVSGVAKYIGENCVYETAEDIPQTVLDYYVGKAILKALWSGTTTVSSDSTALAPYTTQELANSALAAEHLPVVPMLPFEVPDGTISIDTFDLEPLSSANPLEIELYNHGINQLGNPLLKALPEPGGVGTQTSEVDLTLQPQIGKKALLCGEQKNYGINAVDSLLKKTTCSQSELYRYLHIIDEKAAAKYLENGRWPSDVQIPKSPDVLKPDGRIKWEAAKQGGYVLNVSGQAIKEVYMPIKGEIIDRYGVEDGRYASPLINGKPYRYDQRSLPYLENPFQYHQYEVTGIYDNIEAYIDNCSDKNLKADIEAYIRAYNIELIIYKGKIASAFQAIGGGKQYEFPLPMDMLVDIGYLRAIK